MSVMTVRTLCLTEFLLVYEVVSEDPTLGYPASIALRTCHNEFLELASAFPDDANTGAPNKNQWVFPWLFERLRTRESQKWSGTNMHPSHNNNKLGNIMNAFAHFVYEASQNTVVLADIQSMFLSVFICH